jgi:hypothetical protein
MESILETASYIVNRTKNREKNYRTVGVRLEFKL